MKKERYLLIDGIRGLAVLQMIVFHFLYDRNEIFGRQPEWYAHPAVHVWQQVICWTFILISGFVWPMGKKTAVKRGLWLNFCGVVITVVTAIVVPEDVVRFGILNFTGCAILLMLPVHKIAEKVSPVWGSILSFFVFLCSRDVAGGKWGLKGLFTVQLPDILYNGSVSTILGFPCPGFASSDYFPILPWIALYLTGYFLFSLAEKSEQIKAVMYKKIPAVSLIGQKSIWIYMLHQPLCMAVCLLLVTLEAM